MLFTILQSSTITLNVIDEKNNPVPYCAYIVYKDTTKVAGGYCNENGNIKIENLPYGIYKIQIDHLGYETKTVQVEVNKNFLDLGNIQIKPKGIILKEQQVIAQPPIITYEQGKRVIKPSEDLTTIGSTALDILKNVPGVSVDNNDNIQIRGSYNYTLYINGRPTALDPSDALKQIPSSQIDRIEIITNPSARYEAEGNTIINIVLKTTREEGLNYSFNARLGTFENYGANLIFGISNKKLKFSTSLNYNNFNFKNDINIRREVSGNNFQTTGDGYRNTNPYGIRVNLDYNLTKKDILSFEGGLSHWNFDFGGSTNTEGNSNYRTDFFSGRSGLNASLFLGWNRDFINSGFSYSTRGIDELSYNTDISENNKIINATKSTEEGPVNNYRFNFDFDNKNLAFGYLGNIINRDDRYKFYIYDTTQNIYVLKSNYSVNFYRFTNGIYSSYNNNYKKIQYQLGLRFENTKRKIADFEKDYNDIFPSFNISYKLFQTYQFYLNYSRRISHPRPWQLEPFEVQLDQISKRRGNPNLNPEYANSIELGLQTSYTDASIYYRKVENTIDEITTYENNYFITYPENLGFSEFFGSEFSINFKKGRFMEFSSSINTYQQNLYSNKKTSNFSYDLRTTIRLLVLQLTGVYNSPRKGWQGEISQNYYIDAGLRFLYRNFVFVLNFSDILKTNRIKSEVQGTNYYQTQEIKNKWPSIQFIMIYNFQVLRKYQKPQQREEEMEGF